MQTELFMYFCITKCIVTQGEVCRQLKMFNRPPPPLGALCYKAVVPVFLFCVALWFILWGASCFKVFPCSLFSCFFIPILKQRKRKRELVCVLLLVHLFVCFVNIRFCPFSLPLVLGLAAVCDYGTSWTFLLTFLNVPHAALYL